MSDIPEQVVIISDEAGEQIVSSVSTYPIHAKQLVQCIPCENRLLSDINFSDLSNKAFVWLTAVGCVGYLCGVKLATVIQRANAEKLRCRRLEQEKMEKEKQLQTNIDISAWEQPHVVELSPSTDLPTQATMTSVPNREQTLGRSVNILLPDEQMRRYEEDIEIHEADNEIVRSNK